MRRIFFGRHGAQHQDAVTAEGIRQLEQLRTRLEAVGFFGATGVASTEQRTIETARILTYGRDPLPLAVLHAYGDYEHVGVVNPSAQPTWFQSHEYAHRALVEITAVAHGQTDLVVITHDHNPVHLARMYLELHGSTALSHYRNVQFPRPGEGILVEGQDYKFFQA